MRGETPEPDAGRAVGRCLFLIYELVRYRAERRPVSHRVFWSGVAGGLVNTRIASAFFRRTETAELQNYEGPQAEDGTEGDGRDDQNQDGDLSARRKWVGKDAIPPDPSAPRSAVCMMYIYSAEVGSVSRFGGDMRCKRNGPAAKIASRVVRRILGA